MKQSEIISLSTAELQVKLSEVKKTYAELKTAHANLTSIVTTTPIPYAVAYPSNTEFLASHVLDEEGAFGGAGFQALCGSLP